MFEQLTLVVPEKRDIERDAVCETWQAHDGTVLRLGRFWEPPPVDAATVRLYGPDTFCLVLAQKLGLRLCSPDDRLITTLDSDLLHRTVTETRLDEVGELEFPMFVKPVTPKLFRAAVYDSFSSLQAECKGLGDDTCVLISPPVEILAEWRSFVLDGTVTTSAIYEGVEAIDDARVVAQLLASRYELPKTCVVDLAYIDGCGWAVLEFNATWGAGLNGCDALAAATCLAHATSHKR